MGQTMNSKTKVAFCGNVGNNIIEVQKKLQSCMDDLFATANTAKYAAVDRVYNVLAECSTEYSTVLEKNKKTLMEICEGLTKRTDIGEAFVADAKKTLAELEAIPGAVSFDKITAERDGSEIWDSAMQSRVNEGLFAWVGIRKTWIEDLSSAFKAVDDEEFQAAIKPIGKSNEEFTNSMVKNVNTVEEALTELGVDIDKFLAGVTDTAAATGIGATEVKVDLKGASY